jgi:hypothetical protein
VTGVVPGAGLRVLSRARWPESGADTPESLPQVPGFILSSFNPLAAEVARRALSRAPDAVPDRTALLLVSASGDPVTGRAIADAVSEGRRVPPLLFFQSNPNAVLGHIASQHALTGPVVACLGPAAPGGEGAHRAVAAAREAELLLLDGDAEAVLLIVVEQDPDSADTAEALLLDRP